MQIAAQCPVDELQEEDLAAAILIYETMWWHKWKFRNSEKNRNRQKISVKVYGVADSKWLLRKNPVNILFEFLKHYRFKNKKVLNLGIVWP
jgi:hypothetical protein